MPTSNSTKRLSDFPAKSGGHSVLLVEDERGIAEPLTAILEREGYEVVAVETMAAARARGPAADVVVLDWMLPDGQGIDLLSYVADLGWITRIHGGTKVPTLG